jgi:hypothetical protein
MNTPAGRATGIAVTILLLTLVGGALVAYLWEVLNRLFSGHFEPVRLLIAIPVAALLAVLLRYIARMIEGWYARRDA